MAVKRTFAEVIQARIANANIELYITLLDLLMAYGFLELESIKLEHRDGIARITFNQPDRGNPMDLRFVTELNKVASECDEDPETRCVLIDSQGKYFGVGGDLKTMNRDRQQLQVFQKNATSALHSALSRFTRMNSPVIVVAHSLVVGGFTAMCAAADFCLAAGTARFYAAVGVSKLG